MTDGTRANRPVRPMAVGGALVGAGVIAGVWISGIAGGAPVLAAASRDRSDELAAITVDRAELVLLKDASGLYFVLDPTTLVLAPLRVSDVDLRDTPGKSLVHAP